MDLREVTKGSQPSLRQNHAGIELCAVVGIEEHVNGGGRKASVAQRKPGVRTRASVALVGGLVAAGIALSSCGGGTVAPGVANVTTSTSVAAGKTPITVANNATQLFVEWADCMRSHGDPNQADPVITAAMQIDINWSASIQGGPWGTQKGGQGNSGPGQFCRKYLQGAVDALQGNRAPQHPSSAALLKYSECMRANGFPDFPDPSANGGLQLNVGSAMSPSNPAFNRADTLCAQRSGVHPFGSGHGAAPGTIELNGEGP